MLLLDTNIISELRKPKPHGAVVAWYLDQPSANLAIASVTLYELQVGADATRKQDPQKAVELDAWISRITQDIVIYPLGAIEARLTAKLMRGAPREILLDAMIAAIAIANGVAVATRNTRDFERFDVSLINPFLYRA